MKRDNDRPNSYQAQRPVFIAKECGKNYENKNCEITRGNERF